MPQITCTNPETHILKVSKSKISNLLSALFAVAFLTVWYYGLLNPFFGQNDMIIQMVNDIKQNPVILIFYLAPFALIKQVIKNIKVVLNGSEMFFNKESSQVSDGSKKITNFINVAFVQLRTIHLDSNDYRLSLVLRDSSKIFVETFHRESEAVQVAEIIADFVDCEFKRRL